jgi:anti-sigma-K factor RskA
MAGETREELEGFAGEFVLGTLARQERRDAMFRMRTDPDFKRAVEAWDGRLAPLVVNIAPVETPDGLEERILKRIIERRNAPDGVIGLQRQLRRWQRFSLASAAIAAVLVILLFGMLPQQIGAPSGASRYMAVVQAEGQAPGILVSIDLQRDELSARRIEATTAEGKSFELWAVGGGRDKPQSLGLVDPSLKVPASKVGGLTGNNLENTALAVSLEPKGGSPTGQPTGPIVLTGKLIPIN